MKATTRHKTVRPITERMLRQVQKKIMKEPMQFIMSSYFTDSSDLNCVIPNCGTAACIAGWGIALAKGMNPRRACNVTYRSAHATGFESGVKSLRITYEQGRALFNSDNWPEPFNKGWRESQSAGFVSRAIVACARIDHFITTGK